MKRFFVPVLTLPLFFLSACSQTSGFYQYPFSSLKVQYQISGTTEGTSTYTIKGDKSVRESHVIFHSGSGDVHEDNLFIEDGQYSYSVDFNKKTATKMMSSMYYALATLDPSQRQDYLKKINIGVDPQAGSLPPSSGQENIAGQQCDDYTTGGLGTVCLWNTIPLKTSFAIPGLTNNSVATSVQVNIDIPDSAFQVPAGIPVTDATNPGTQQTTEQATQQSTQQ